MGSGGRNSKTRRIEKEVSAFFIIPETPPGAKEKAASPNKPEDPREIIFFVGEDKKLSNTTPSRSFL